MTLLFELTRLMRSEDLSAAGALLTVALSKWGLVRFGSAAKPPPMPIQSAEYSAWPLVCWVAVGTIQLPVIELNTVSFFSSSPGW